MNKKKKLLRRDQKQTNKKDEKSLKSLFFILILIGGYSWIITLSIGGHWNVEREIHFENFNM